MLMLRLSINVNRQFLNARGVQRLTERKFSRLVHNSTNATVLDKFLFDAHKYSRVHAIYVVRHQSTVHMVNETVPKLPIDKEVQWTENTVSNVNTPEVETDLISKIPDAPIPLREETTTTVEVLNALGEPTFKSLGLGGYGPIGLSQYLFEWFHVSLTIPWWEAIMITTLFIKILSTPLIALTVKNQICMRNYLPQIMKLQLQMSEARQCGDHKKMVKYSHQLQICLKESKLSVSTIFLSFSRILTQVPIFMALRGMSSLPVESMKTGGLWWFTDLNIPDPYYLLPFISTCTLCLNLRDSFKVSEVPAFTIVLRILPGISFLFGAFMPSGLLIFWITTNIVTLAQMELFKIKAVRTLFRIPDVINHPKESVHPKRKKSFKDSLQESWKNISASQKIHMVERADEVQFNKAGKEIPEETFKYNPNSKRNLAKSVAAMKK